MSDLELRIELLGQSVGLLLVAFGLAGETFLPLRGLDFAVGDAYGSKAAK
jgi:hypothetical protein